MLRMMSFGVPDEPDCAGPFWTRRPARRGTLRVFIDGRELVEKPYVWAGRDGVPFHFSVVRKSGDDSLWVDWHPDRDGRREWMKGATIRVVYEEPDEVECPYRQDGMRCSGGPVRPTRKIQRRGSETVHEWECPGCRWRTWWSYRAPDPVPEPPTG
jgi:hypothetical protein